MHNAGFMGHTLTLERGWGLETEAKSLTMANIEILTKPELQAEIKIKFKRNKG